MGLGRFPGFRSATPATKTCRWGPRISTPRTKTCPWGPQGGLLLFHPYGMENSATASRGLRRPYGTRRMLVGLSQDSVRRGGLHPGLISFSPYGREWRACIVVSHPFANSAKGWGNRPLSVASCQLSAFRAVGTRRNACPRSTSISAKGKSNRRSFDCVGRASRGPLRSGRQSVLDCAVG